jgi:alpha-L-rhamnosidase
MRRLFLACLTAFGLASGFGAGVGGVFSLAEPVWPEGRERELNSACQFRCRIPGGGTGVRLRATAAYNYRARLNGKFVGYGPLRAEEGVFRVDEWPLDLEPGENELVVEVAGYNCNSYYFVNQQAFFAAEVVAGGKVLAATGESGAFKAYPSSRIRKAPRYSGQRTFIDAWKVGEEAREAMALKRMTKEVSFRERGFAYPDFAPDRTFKAVCREKLVPDGSRKIKKPSFIEQHNRPHRQVFKVDELETNPFYEMQRYDFVPQGDRRMALKPGESVMFEGEKNSAGFFVAEVECAGPCRVVMMFDELADGGKIDFTRLSSAQVAEWRIAKAGKYGLETFEPYAAKGIRVAVMDGSADIKAVWVRSYVSPLARATFRSSDGALDKIFSAALESYKANAVDGFTDCPTRERACWAGDTFFTARASAWITGEKLVERDFLANFLLKKGGFDFSQYDSKGVDMTGAIPALYPGCVVWSNFIPNWMMWTVLQLEEYVERYGDRDFALEAKPAVMGIEAFFRRFVNSDGLLEKLPGWVFVEWSRANMLVQDVNYPSNMMYARMLEAIGRLYGDGAMSERAAAVRREVVRQSWNGEWFCDNSVRQKDGKLKLSGECTETCQYAAFFFGTVTPATHSGLWRRLLDDFGPDRVAKGVHPKIWPANFIFGTCERLELLSRAGRHSQILGETRGFFLKMAERTGTLWEHLDTRASCCHGFSSIAAEYMLRDVLGVKSIDRVRKVVEVAPSADMPLEWCEGTIPVENGGVIKVRWERGADGKISLAVEVPEFWRTADSLNVGSYNIRYAGGDRTSANSWDARREDVAAMIRKLDLDVFGLQEVEHSQAEFLRKRLPEYAIVGDHRNADRISGEASPVCYRVSRFELLKKSTFWLSEQPDVPGLKGWGAACPRVCTFLVLRDRRTQRKFCFANIHTDHISAEAREKGMKLVLERVSKENGPMPVILVGDHNCLETDPPALAATGVLDDALYASSTVPRGPWRTFNGWKRGNSEVSIADALSMDKAARNAKGKRIDYIYVSKGTKVSEYAVHDDLRPSSAGYPSDHFPVTAVVDFGDVR